MRRDRNRQSTAINNEVGYGKPPRAHRFKPGKSGNPKGRPKGSQNTNTVLHTILDRKIEVRSGGTSSKVSVREAILTRIVEDALKGNPKSAAFLFSRYDSLNIGDSAGDAINEDDQAIIDAFREKIHNSKKKE